ncbi:MAG: SixA phosphatase family protein [Ramlibacter sp.]
MDLILWRHAQAHESSNDGDDLVRALTPRGERDALRMGQWLSRRLPRGTRVLVSPALRCEQTALGLGREFQCVPQLAPGASVEELLEQVGWPDAARPVVVVGHQPTLGQTLAHLLGMAQASCPVRKGAAWWLHRREREERPQVALVGVMAPDMLGH